MYQMFAVTQEQAALSDGALMADASQGWALIRKMRISSAARQIARLIIDAQPQQAPAPADFAAAGAAFDAGERNIEHGRIDWAAVEDEAIGS